MPSRAKTGTNSWPLLVCKMILWNAKNWNCLPYWHCRSPHLTPRLKTSYSLNGVVHMRISSYLTSRTQYLRPLSWIQVDSTFHFVWSPTGVGLWDDTLSFVHSRSCTAGWVLCAVCRRHPDLWFLSTGCRR